MTVREVASPTRPVTPPQTPETSVGKRPAWLETLGRWGAQAVPGVAAVAAALLVSALMIAAMGHDVVTAFDSLLTASFDTQFGFVATLHRWVPLTLFALAFTIPLIAGRYNIGSEGQMLVGAAAAAGVGISGSGLPAPVLLPLVLLAGILAGLVWAGIAAWLLDQFGVNEILSTVLLNFVSFGVVLYTAQHLWPDPVGGFPMTDHVAPAAQLPMLGSSPQFHSGVLLVLAVSILVILAIRYTVIGYELRSVGANPRAALIHGVSVRSVAIGALVVGGALAGLAGSIEVAGVQGRLLEGMQSNYLQLGIIIGLIARGSVVAVPLVAFGISVLEIGASAMQRSAEVPVQMVLIVEALILIFILIADILADRITRRRAARAAVVQKLKESSA